MAGPIVVIGCSTADFSMKMEHLPRPGETATGAVFVPTFGGKGVNQAIVAAQVSGASPTERNVYLINAVGDDLNGVLIRDHLRSGGVNVETVRVESGIGSGAALVMVAENGQRYRAVAPGANDRLTPDCVDEHGALLRSAALIVLQSELPADTVERIIRVGFHLGKKILLNVGPGQPVDPALLPYLYVLVVNAAEAEEMVGTPVETPEQAQAAARELQARGPLVAVITLGARGAAIAGPELDAVINEFPVTGGESASVDDVFCGSMAVALAEGRSIQAAARFAGAAVAVTRRGAQPSLPKRDEIEALLAAPC